MTLGQEVNEREIGGTNMKVKKLWISFIPTFFLFFIAACSDGEDIAPQENTEPISRNIVAAEQNLEDHSGLNDSPAEPIIGESTVETPIDNKEHQKK